MLLVLMSIEKCFAVYFPLKSKTVCTVKTAKWATGVVGVILAGYNLQWFVLIEPEVSKKSVHYSCVPTEHYQIFYSFVDSVLYSFGPFALMFVTNFAIVLRFLGAKYKSNSTESTNQALAKSATRETAMVVTVSVTFLILTAPSALYSALSHVVNVDLCRAFMNLTQYLNHSINGVLYIIVGSRFRRELLNIFNCKKYHNNLSSTHSVKTMSLSSSNGNKN